jgi:hypothetical protein
MNITVRPRNLCGIIDPIGDVLSLISNVVFKVLVSVSQVQLVISGVMDLNDGVDLMQFLTARRFTQELFCADLHRDRDRFWSKYLSMVILIVANDFSSPPRKELLFQNDRDISEERRLL